MLLPAQHRTLELQENQYENELDSRMFKKAAYLQAVDLSNNKIKSIPAELFDTNQFLQVGNQDISKKVESHFFG